MTHERLYSFLADSCIAFVVVVVVVVVVLEFHAPLTAKVIWRRVLGLNFLFERLEKPGIELTTPCLQGDYCRLTIIPRGL